MNYILSSIDYLNVYLKYIVLLNSIDSNTFKYDIV